eukprot:1327941-Amorphochlora_amoeboformis.AAC.1
MRPFFSLPPVRRVVPSLAFKTTLGFGPNFASKLTEWATGRPVKLTEWATGRPVSETFRPKRLRK